MNLNGKSVARGCGRFYLPLRRLGGIGLLCLTPLAPLPAWAATPPQDDEAPLEHKRHFEIPAQSLASALLIFGQQSGLQVSADSELLEGLRSPAVAGRMSAWDALDRLLQGSGLHWRYGEPNLVSLFRVDLSNAVSAGDMWVIDGRK